MGIIKVKDLKIRNGKIETMDIFNRLVNETNCFSTVSKLLIALKSYLAFVTENNPVNHNHWSYIPLMGTQVNDRDICNSKSNFFYLVES